MILLDTGDMFQVRRNKLSDLKATTAVKAMNLMDYDVVGLGEMELTYGKEKLDAFFKDAKFRIIGSNVIDLEDGKGYTEPYVILKRGSLKIGVFSAVYNSTNYLTYAFKKIEDFKLREPEVVIGDILGKLEKKTDFIIFISHMGEDKAIEIAKKFPSIDLIVSGHNTYKKMTDHSQTLKKIDNTLVVFTNAKSQALGYIDLEFDRKHNLVAYAETNRLLNADFADNPEIKTILDDYDKKSRELKNELFPKKSAKALKSRKYVGAESCKECHAEIYDSWIATPHASALATLADQGMENNQECLVCHMTGFRIRRTVEEAEKDYNLPGVQCEACHGKGSRHLEDKDKTRVYGRTYKYICQRCHTSERDKDFDFEKDKLLVHPVPQGESE